MGYIKTNFKENSNSINLYYEDYGSGQPIVLIHGWPLSHRMWDNQIEALVNSGFRVIAYDRRGFGQSSKPFKGYDYNTMACDLKDLIDQLELKNIILAGFSMGGGEVARYIGRYGTQNVSKAILISAVTPFLKETKDNPDAVDSSVFDGMKDGITKDRAGFFEEFGKNFVNFDKLNERISSAQVHLNWNIAMNASRKATLDCVDAFGLTDFREDLKAFDIPTKIIHGNNDGIVPFEVSGKKAHEAIPNAELSLIENGPHGLSFTHPNELNEAIIEFLK
ncbi:alpha/beta fold hydrolase [Flavobacteriaceae bacterium 14752]|uniref:alpha/beta fold hydrolase n=1 Tax=Mesohalobacter salilacus TaxID=2491711 RepID=UPI000F63E8EF|nr:alpha/beta hydrolase [Flavobacteriaceae bacterium 14752]